MKKKKIVIILALFLLIIILGILLFFLTRPRESAIVDREPIIFESVVEEGEVEMVKEGQQYVEHQVLAVADSKHEAKKIAKAVGGELISFENQVATIQIGITVEEMMQKLEEDSSLPKVYPNYQNYTY